MTYIILFSKYAIGRERKIAVEKQQAYYQSQVSADKRQLHRPVVPGE